MRRTHGCWVLLALGLACAESTQPDTTPPAVIRDLRVATSTESSVVLEWTAPGDDGRRGYAAAYDLRYTTEPVREEWSAFTRVEPMPLPGKPGDTDTRIVFELSPQKSYVFVIRTVDSAGNWSNPSEWLVAKPGDVQPPARVTNLAVAPIGPRVLRLEFTMTGDDGIEGEVAASGGPYRASPAFSQPGGVIGARPVAGCKDQGKGSL